MKTHLCLGQLKRVLKLSVFIVLSVISFNVSAAHLVYVGNPSRPDTIYVPAHCRHGCYVAGYYIKFVDPPVCSNSLIWIGNQYDTCGNFIPGHWYHRGWYNYRHHAPVYCR